MLTFGHCHSSPYSQWLQRVTRVCLRRRVHWLPHRSQCWSDPCCRRWSHSSCDPVGLWSPRSCSLRSHNGGPSMAGSAELQISTLPFIGFFKSSEVIQWLPVQVMMISTRRITSFSLTTLNPSMLGQEDVCKVCVKLHGGQHTVSGRLLCPGIMGANQDRC